MQPRIMGGLIMLAMSAAGQSLQIGPAVEIEYATDPHTIYQIESSSDLASWSPFRSSILGTGSPIEVFARATESPVFFRLDTHPVRDLAGLLEPIRATHRVPALACAVVVSNR